MTSDFTEETATEAVVDSFAHTEDPRLREILESFTRHLHGFVRDVEPTQAEWEAAIGFLTAVGATALLGLIQDKVDVTTFPGWAQQAGTLAVATVVGLLTAYVKKNR